MSDPPGSSPGPGSPEPEQQPPYGSPEPGAQPPYRSPGGGQPPPYGSPGGGQPPPYGSPGGGQPPYGQPPYGQPPYGQPPYVAGEGHGPPRWGTGRPEVETYLIPAILAAFCCCQPTGIVAIVYAVQVSSKLGQGNVHGAMQASEKARFWMITSIVAGLLGYGLLAVGQVFFLSFWVDL